MSTPKSLTAVPEYFDYSYAYCELVLCVFKYYQLQYAINPVQLGNFTDHKKLILTSNTNKDTDHGEAYGLSCCPAQEYNFLSVRSLNSVLPSQVVSRALLRLPGGSTTKPVLASYRHSSLPDPAWPRKALCLHCIWDTRFPFLCLSPFPHPDVPSATICLDHEGWQRWGRDQNRISEQLLDTSCHPWAPSSWLLAQQHGRLSKCIS